jgi:hypothetical protein
MNDQASATGLWHSLLDLALELVREDPRHALATDADLLQRLLKPAHAEAPEPHSNTLDLLYVFATNLNRTNASGSLRWAFARMVRVAAEPFVRNGCLAALSVREFAEHFLQLLNAGSERLAVGPAAHSANRQQLELLARGQRPLRATCSLVPLLSSVVEFSVWLNQVHGGCAAAMHQGFAAPVTGRLPNTGPRGSAEAMEHLPLIRIWSGLRFLKESQTTGFAVADAHQASQSLARLRQCQAGWLVQPDLHVLRLMLHLTGRAADVHIEGSDLAHLRGRSASSLQTLYALARPARHAQLDYQLQRGRAREERGLWQCMEDLQHLAWREGVAPVALDRLLSLIGSGEYAGADLPLAVPQRERYARFLQRMSEFAVSQPVGGIAWPARPLHPGGEHGAVHGVARA